MKKDLSLKDRSALVSNSELLSRIHAMVLVCGQRPKAQDIPSEIRGQAPRTIPYIAEMFWFVPAHESLNQELSDICNDFLTWVWTDEANKELQQRHNMRTGSFFSAAAALDIWAEMRRESCSNYYTRFCLDIVYSLKWRRCVKNGAFGEFMGSEASRNLGYKGLAEEVLDCAFRTSEYFKAIYKRHLMAYPSDRYKVAQDE